MGIPEFYEAFAPACFALLGLWFVALQIRDTEWKGDSLAQRRAYGVALSFALPGVMSLLALVDISTHTFWQVSFAIVGLGGAVAMFFVFWYHVQARRVRIRLRHLTVADWIDAAACASIGLYLAVGALAAVGGATSLRTVAVLLTIAVFLGFNLGWLLLVENRSSDTGSSAPTDAAAAAADRRRDERDPASFS